jgi:hypothetical protein
MLWWCAFFPGALSYDSVYQWESVKNNNYESIFPILYSLLIKLIQLFSGGPGIVGFAQILVTASIVTAYFDIFIRQGINKFLCYVMVGFFCLSCIVGIYNITLWKDVFFTQSIALLGLVFLKVYFKEITINKKSILLISLLLVITASLRINGIIYLFLAGVFIVFGLRKNKKLIMTSLLCLGISIIVIFFAIPSIFQQSNIKGQSLIKLMQLQTMAAIIRMNGSISPEAKVMANEVIPIEDINGRYHCSAVDYLINKNPNLKINKIDNKIYLKMLIDNIPLVLADRVCLFGFLTGIGENTHQFLFYNIIEQNTSGIVQIPNNELKTFLNSYLKITSDSILRYVFWSHFLEICIFLVLGCFAFFKKEYYKAGFLLIIFINVPFIFLFNLARDFRYLYMLTFCLPFAVLLAFVKKRKISK